MDPGACGYLHLASGMRTILLQKKSVSWMCFLAKREYEKQSPNIPAGKDWQKNQCSTNQVGMQVWDLFTYA